MLKIGEFAHLSQVPIKTLRYYDEIGLFKPTEVDCFTKHRYYTLQQLPVIHRIMALKGLGLSLEQIGLMEDDELDESDIRGMLRLKRAELQQTMRETQQRLDRVQFRLKMIGMETTMSDLNVTIKELAPIDVMSLQWHPNLSPKLREEIFAAVDAGQIQHTGKFMQIFDSELMNEDWSNASYVLEVEPTQPDEDVELPTMGTFKRNRIAGAQHAAVMVIHGAEDGNPREIQGQLNRWAVENGYQLCGESRVVYHQGPMHEKDRSEWVLELQAIVEPRD